MGEYPKLKALRVILNTRRPYLFHNVYGHIYNVPGDFAVNGQLFMKRRLIYFLVLLLPILAIACHSSNQDDLYAEDPYGTNLAQEEGEISTRLIWCSQNQECPEYAEALFWVAADILSEAGATEHEYDAVDLELTDDMSVEEMINKAGPVLEALIDDGPPEYDVNDVEFQRGLEMMTKAYAAGNIYAANELGLLHLELPAMKDHELAREYFESVMNSGDPFGAYNLARLVRTQTPEDHKKILYYLNIAAESENPDMKAMSMLAYESFGNDAEKQKARRYFQLNYTDASYLRSEFKEHFNIY